MTLSADAHGISKAGETIEDWEPRQVPMIRYKGTFDWQGIYRLTRRWLEHNNYKFNEKKYKHKGDEVEIDMVGERKIDEMHKYNIHIHFHTWYMKEKEIMINNKKTTVVEGNIHIEMHAVLQLDWTERFQKGKLNQMLFRWYKVVRKNNITAEYLEPLSIDLYKLHTDLKTFLNMTTDTNYYGS